MASPTRCWHTAPGVVVRFGCGVRMTAYPCMWASSENAFM